MNKENWIEEVVQASRHIQPVECNPYLATRVEAALLKHTDAGRLPLRWVWLSAAGLAALLVLNVLAWSSRPQPQKPASIQSVMQEYGWSNSDYSANN